MVLLCKVALCSAVQIEAIAESLLEIPQGVNHRIDWTDNVISHWVEFGAPVRGLSRVPTADSYCREATDRLAVGQNADGRLEIFARGADGGWQTAPSNGWSGWASLGGWIDQLAVNKNADGRIEIFARGSDKTLWHKWQTVQTMVGVAGPR